MRMAERSGQHIDEDDEKLLEKETKKCTSIPPPSLPSFLSSFLLLLTLRLSNLLLFLFLSIFLFTMYVISVKEKSLKNSKDGSELQPLPAPVTPQVS